MPFSELKRRDSWPPTIVHLPASASTNLTLYDPSLIDENPISFFLTSPEDIDADDFEDLSAGIESSSSKRPVIREISPSSLQRVPRLEEEDEEEDEFEIPMTLRDFTARYNSTSGRQSRAGNHGATGLGITLPDQAALRGRARVRLIPRGRGRARTLSARRPQSWREPSPDIWRIEEEEEGERKVGGEAMGRSVSTPGTVSGGILKASSSPGPKKRVHWADA